MQSLRVSNTRCLPEKSSSRARGVFSNKTRFVFAHEAHLCHRTDFLFEALVAMLRTCVFLRHPYISAAQLQEWSMRKRVTYQAVIVILAGGNLASYHRSWSCLPCHCDSHHGNHQVSTYITKYIKYTLWKLMKASIADDKYHPNNMTSQFQAWFP